MIVVTGATGRTGRRVTEALLTTGVKVRAVGRDSDKLAPLARLGAEPFVGGHEDLSNLTKAFSGATAAYLLLPEDLSQVDLRAHQERVSDAFAAAVTSAGVPFVVNLSSLGAQHAEGTGPIVGLHIQEQKLNQVVGLNVLHIRAAYFMDNLYNVIAPLSAAGILPGGMRGDARMPWIAARDIGTYAASRLATLDFLASSTQELHGQRDLSFDEAASIVGKAIGRPEIAYVQAPPPELETTLVGAGLPKRSAELILEMWVGANSGLMSPQEARSARNTTPTSLEAFASEYFAPAYNRATGN